MGQPSKFFELPRELRDQIYSYAFERTPQVLPDSPTGEPRPRRLAIEPLLTSKAFFEEASPYLTPSQHFIFRNVAKLHAFLCGWSGPKAQYGQYITYVTLKCSSFGGLESLTERCPRLRTPHVHFSSSQNPWLDSRPNWADIPPEVLIEIGGMRELHEMRRLDTFTFCDVDLPTVQSSGCRCGKPHRMVAGLDNVYWSHNIKALERYVRAAVTQPSS